MKRSAKRERAIVMAVDMLVVSIFQSIRERETAIKVLLPDEQDSNSAVLTAITSAFGLLLASRYNDRQYDESILHFARVLRLGEDGFRAQVKKLEGRLR